MGKMSSISAATNYLLSFEISAESDELFIHADPSGLRRLAALLETLAKEAEKGEFPHEHLFTQEWGGAELTSVVQEIGHRCLMHVKVYGWPDSRGALPYQQGQEDNES
jgi:hypothetical protein